MAKESYVSILGLQKRKAIELLATVSDKATANWHINHTFKDKYQHLITKVVHTKGYKFVPDEIAKDKGKYLRYRAKMNTLDWDTLDLEVMEGTLLGFSKVVDPDGLKNEKAVGKLGEVYVTATCEDERNITLGLDVVIPESEAFPYKKVIEALRKAVIEYVTEQEGLDAPVEDNVAIEDEEVSEEQEQGEVGEVAEEPEEAKGKEVEEKPKTKDKEQKETKKTKAPKKEEIVAKEEVKGSSASKEATKVQADDEVEEDILEEVFDFELEDEAEGAASEVEETKKGVSEVEAGDVMEDDPFDLMEEDLEDPAGKEEVVKQEENMEEEPDVDFGDDFDFDFEEDEADEKGQPKEAADVVDDFEDFDIDAELEKLDD